MPSLDVQIREVQADSFIAENPSFISRAAKDGIAIRDDGTTYLVAFKDQSPVGIVGFKKMPNGSVRYKSAWVLGLFRNRGVYKKLFLQRESYFDGVTGITCTAYSSAYSRKQLLQAGFAAKTELSNRDTVYMTRKK